MPTGLTGYLALVTDGIGVCSFLYVVYRWLGRRLWFRWKLQKMERRLSARPVALAVGIGTDITGSVKSYLNDNNLLIPLETYYRKAPPGSNVYRPRSSPRLRRRSRASRTR